MFFDYVLVIESLRASDKRTGEELYNSIIKRKCKQFCVGAQYRYVRSFDEFKKVFEEVEFIITEYKKFPLIHIEAHGEEDSIEFESGEKIHWVTISTLLASVNYHSKNNLFVILSSCFAINLARAAKIFLVPPYRVLLAPTTAIRIHELEEGFVEFYEELFSSLAINGRVTISKAVDKLRKSSGGAFIIIFIEDRFELLWTEFREEYNTIERLNRFVDNLKDYGAISYVLTTEQLRKIFLSSLEQGEAAKKYFFDSFMLRDIQE